MKIVDLDEFLKLPPKTVFMKVDPWSFYELCIKGDSLPNRDFMFNNITSEIDAVNSSLEVELLEDSVNHGCSVPLDFKIYGRDGMKEKHQLFAVYEEQDTIGLISALSETL